MTAPWKCALAGVLLALFSCLAWVWWATTDAPPGDAVGGQRRTASTDNALPAGDTTEREDISGTRRQPVETAGEDPGFVQGVGRLRIRVDDQSGNPVPGALISRIAYDEDRGYFVTRVQATTDDAGEAILSPHDDGEPERGVLIQKENFVTKACWYDPEQGDEQVVVLDRAASLSGRVLEFESQKPIVGAQLRFSSERVDAGNPVEIFTDSAGRYRYSRLPVGDGPSIEVIRPGRIPFWQEVGTTSPGDNYLDVFVPMGRSLTGVVIDATTGEPLSAVGVFLGSPVYEGLTTADTSGRFELRGLFAEEYFIDVWSAGYCVTERSIQHEVLETGKEIVFPLFRACSVEGIVREVGGAPVEDACIELDWIHSREDSRERDRLSETFAGFDWDGLQVLSWPEYPDAATDQDGRFLLTGLRPGPTPVVLEAQHDDWREPRLSNPIIFDQPGERRVVDTWSEPHSGVIEGAVPAGIPRTLSVYWEGPSACDSSGVGLNGRYRLEGVESGTVDLSLRSGPLSEAVTIASATVEVRDGATTIHDFAIEKEIGVVAGRVAWTDGEPVRGADIQVTLGDVRYSARSWRRDGSFQVVVVAEAGTPCELDYRIGSSSWIPVRDVRVGDEPLELVLPSTRKAQLRILDAVTGVPVPSVRVGWRMELGGLLRDAWSGEEWSPRMQGAAPIWLPEGKMTLRLEAPTLGYPVQEIEGFEVSDPQDIMEIRLHRVS
ncbi:MAG: carboxypeptidase regulatory-like domain-containing protein [Planctomycetota bacterium]